MTQKQNSLDRAIAQPIRVGLVGTGYAAKRRAEGFQADERSQLKFVTGNTPANIESFCQTYGVAALDSWQTLVNHPEVDLVVICTINSDRSPIVRGALEAGKHVVIEYPLALAPQEAEEAIALAEERGKLLHVEHIELLGGLHQAIRQYLPEIGEVFYARYATLSPQHPVSERWTYHRELFGFPLSAALSRVHRFTNLFGAVDSVTCQSRFWGTSPSGYYRACLCKAQLNFSSGLLAEVVYGKGEVFWQGDRTFELHGDRGVLIFAGETGTLIRGEETTPISVASRRGLFAKDTQMVLDRLFDGSPLYVTPNASLYALKVADAARQSAETEKIVYL